MSDERKERSELKGLPEPELRQKKRGISIVWLVPLLALAVGGWLVYKAITEKGPTITITFKSAAGLEAGKTKIKYKDVELGQVVSIDLDENLSEVILKAELVKKAENFISQNTRFWVVRARVSAGSVTGLGTLFSGAYIGLDPGAPGQLATHFTGLEIPPVVTTDLPGSHFQLRSASLGSLNIGDLVYFRRIEVGRIVSYKLDEDGQAVTIKIFIHDPHHELVRKNTRFWNASGLDFSISADGIQVNTESFMSIMVGGIAFDTHPDQPPGEPAAENAVFELFKNHESTTEKIYTRKNRWLLYFDGGVRGLQEGAPVELQGIQIGQVLDVKLEFDVEKDAFRIPVLIETEPDRITSTGKMPEGAENQRTMDFLVAKGMRAQLKTGSLITGQLLVAVDMFPEAPPAKIDWDGIYPVLPTIPTAMEEITTSLTQLLNKLEKVPIEQIGNELRDTIAGAKRLMNSPDLQQSATILNETLNEAQRFVAALNKNVAPELDEAVSNLNAALIQAQKLARSLNSNVAPQADRTLRELQSAARSIKVWAEYLERHPEALIRGKGKSKRR
ncbi:Paraquat-inducible protein B [Olavius algarvensis Delta 1 endosymbiont]|nr:Paraquat-inducible protein B [Olavius algarvensis Delta 1 endosymbiont]